MEKKKKRISIPLIVAMAVCILVLIFSIWQLVSIYLEYKRGTDEYDALQQYVNEALPETEYGEDIAEEESEEGEEDTEQEERLARVSFDELKAINEEIVGWIQIPGTQISYPIMHGDDDAYYLNHTFSGNVNSSGSIFMEALNSGDFSDLHTIIYGHNMKNGAMFAGLKSYQSPSYLVSHPTVYVDLQSGTHAYQIFSCYETEANSDSYTIGFAQDDQYAEFLSTLKSRSAYDTGVDVSVEDSIITLSTCTKSGEKRFVIHAKKIW
jgi:sortase B